VLHATPLPPRPLPTGSAAMVTVPWRGIGPAAVEPGVTVSVTAKPTARPFVRIRPAERSGFR
jgi:hypothetical protein